MGIARRKAGQVVRCPKCAGQVVVPRPRAAEPGPPAPGNQPVFEGSDFDALFNPEAPVAEEDLDFPAPPAPRFAATPAPVPASHRSPIEPGFDVERILPVPQAALPVSRPGIVLSPTMATVLSVAVIVGLALAFGIGLVVGYLIRQGSHEEPKPESRAARVVLAGDTGFRVGTARDERASRPDAGLPASPVCGTEQGPT